MRVPAICDACGFIFPSRIDVSDNIHVSFAGISVSPCPACGNVGHIPDGLYHFIDNTISLLSGPSRSYEELTRLGSLLKSAIGSKNSPEQISNDIKKEAPELSRLAEILPKTRTELYAFLTIILTIISILLNYKRSEPRQVVNVEQVINAIYNQEKPDKKHQVVRPKLKSTVHPPPIKKHKKVGRNDKCPCGSGKKYKYCCIKKG